MTELLRTPWPENFPDVVVHTEVSIRNASPYYKAAKAGDHQAANRLCYDLDNLYAVLTLESICRNHSDVYLLPVSAIEQPEDKETINAIPDAFAAHLKEELLLLNSDVYRTDFIIQNDKVGHTKSNKKHEFHHFVTPPTFEGKIETDRPYILVDDHVGFGSTLANLRGHVESQGGNVIAMTTLTSNRDGHKIRLSTETLNVLRYKYDGLEEFWIKNYGYGLDCLTGLEGDVLAREQSFDAIREKLTEARDNAIRLGFKAVPLEESD